MKFYEKKNFNCFSTSSKAHHRIRCDFFIDIDNSDRNKINKLLNKLSTNTCHKKINYSLLYQSWQKQILFQPQQNRPRHRRHCIEVSRIQQTNAVGLNRELRASELQQVCWRQCRRCITRRSRGRQTKSRIVLYNRTQTKRYNISTVTTSKHTKSPKH